MLDSYFELRMILRNVTNDYFYFRFTSFVNRNILLPESCRRAVWRKTANPSPITVIGVRSWSDFALSANRGERVSDAFGAAERLLLTASSSICARTSPSIAIFDPAYGNEGLLDPSNTASGGAAFLGASERFPVCPCEPDWANQIGTFP